MGGRFRSIMPSDLAAPGALAFESIPARGDQYARPGIKRELTRIFRRDGCHHCGSRGGPVIGDHMPPNKLALRGNGQLGAWLGEAPIIKQVGSGRVAWGRWQWAPHQGHSHSRKVGTSQHTGVVLGGSFARLQGSNLLF
jgi:hypothetical protein